MSPSTDHPPPFPVARRHGCRPDGCAGLCTDDGLAHAHQIHHGTLLRRANMLLRDRGLAEEAVQETFVRAWRACASFDPAAGPMVNWLAAILRNVSLDLLKARRRRPTLTRTAPEDNVTAPRRPDDVDLMLLRNDLNDALAMIAKEHRAALIETILRDRTYHDVAAELGVPVGTIRSRVFYALRKLADLLDPTDLAA